MADNPPAQPPPSDPQPPPADFHIGDEFSGAKRNLPPARILLICIVAVAVILGVYAYINRAKPQGGGSIDNLSAVEITGQNSTMVAVTFSLQNGAEKPLWIRSLKGILTTSDDQKLEDRAASAVDFDRYFQAFPALKENSRPAFSPEMKLMPGARQSGTIIVSFPVTKDVFDQRKSLEVSIQPYDQPVPIVLKK